jgi:hypothetical protein
MSNPQGPDDPFAPKPEEPANEPAAPGPVPPEQPPAPPYGQPPAPGYGQPPTPGNGQPPYGQPTGDVPVAPPYGQQPPVAEQPFGQPYPSASQYPSAPPPSYGAAPQYTQGYGATPYDAIYPKNQVGVWALVLGIASLVACGFIAGIPAIILGRQGQRAADEGQANNRSLSTAGMVLGWISVAFSIIGIIIFIIAVSVAGTSNFMHTNP